MTGLVILVLRTVDAITVPNIKRELMLSKRAKLPLEGGSVADNIMGTYTTSKESLDGCSLHFTPHYTDD
jgi:hypothetical protein